MEMCYIKIITWICFISIVTNQVEGFGLKWRRNSNTTIPDDNSFIRVRRQTAVDCTSDTFKCKSGECIDEDAECDGKVDCRDGSDEGNACQRIRCRPFLFRCNYGACISKIKECDGKQDCRDGSDESNVNCKRTNAITTECSSDEFHCSSGQCIDLDFKCDGTAQCADHSDEIAATCSQMRCPRYTHRCAYGACVNGNSVCNGINECYDGSDEDPRVCGTTIPIPTPKPPPVTPPRVDPTIPRGSCALPKPPDHGRIELSDGGVYTTGVPVRSGTPLTVECNRNYKLDGVTVILCKNGLWSSHVGVCKLLCDPIYNTDKMRVTCNYNGVEKNCTDVLSGTIATFKCVQYYEDFALSLKPISICSEGTWSAAKPNCAPVCGVKTPSAQTLLVNGTKVKHGDYPWQVAIYLYPSKQFSCGGSLLSQRLILTAAHCVTDLADGTLYPKENYIVAVGKYYRDFDDKRDNQSQSSLLEAMYKPREYEGAKQNFLGDIAILVTKKIIIFNLRAQPVCLDWGQRYDVEFSAPDISRYVTGWGYTYETGNLSEVLKELKVPLVNYDTCKLKLPEDFDIYLTSDKICAGFLDQSQSACKGDSGGGLVFKNQFNGRYYVTGVVSLSPPSEGELEGCNKNQYGLYTKVHNYISNFIIPQDAKYKT